MRRVRGGRNKDLGLFVNLTFSAKDDWMTYLLVLLAALTGTLMGLLINKIASTVLILITIIFLGLVLGGLITAWAINQKNQLLENFTLQEGFKEQFNAFSLIINELEHNLNVGNCSQVRTKAWQDLQYKYSYFPIQVYDDLYSFYSQLEVLVNRELDIIQYRQVILEELKLPDLLAQLKDWQQRIKRQLPYFD